MSLVHRAGFAGAFVDREVETKGLDFIDREKAKYQGEIPHSPSSPFPYRLARSLELTDPSFSPAQQQLEAEYDNRYNQY